MTAPAIELRSVPAERVDAATIQRLSVVIPLDALREKRLANLARASQVIIALRHDDPVGVVFVRAIAGIPNVTWLVHESARRQGLAVAMLNRLQQDWRWLTAICRNEASIAVAKRAGFRLAGPFALWIR